MSKCRICGKEINPWEAETVVYLWRIYEPRRYHESCYLRAFNNSLEKFDNRGIPLTTND